MHCLTEIYHVYRIKVLGVPPRPTWEWMLPTGLVFPGSGDYIVPGALNPVTIDREQNVGLYREPNIWVVHAVDQTSG